MDGVSLVLNVAVVLWLCLGLLIEVLLLCLAILALASLMRFIRMEE